MNYSIVFRFLGNLAFTTGFLFFPALVLALWFREYSAIGPFLGATAVSWIAGAILAWFGRGGQPLVTQREGLLTVSAAWFFVGGLGALPFVFSGLMAPIPALFESISGFTTTGASTLDNIESFPKSILFWRAMTQWLGGIGIVVMFVAILPHLGAGGKHLFKTESSGPDVRGLRPRIRQSAAILIGIYCVLTILNVLFLLMTGSMGLFDAVCHTFATLSTGGFSTMQGSIGAFDSLGVELVTIVFMVAGGTSFALYYELYRDRRISFIRNAEWRVYILIMFFAAILIAMNLTGHFGLVDLREQVGGAVAERPESNGDNAPTFLHAARVSAFTVTSVMTSTGFATEDYDQWPYFARMLLLLLMFVGGCAGSTGGGMKVVRILMVVKLLAYRVERSFRPKIVRVLRISGQPVSEEVERDAATFVLAYLVAFGVGVLIVSSLGAPFETAVTAVTACLTNVGPGLELVGPAQSYSVLPDPSLLVLTAGMVLGRLEVFTVLVLLMPDFWRRRR